MNLRKIKDDRDTFTVTLSGGYNNMPPIMMEVPAEDREHLVSGALTLADVLTEEQDRMLDEYFMNGDGDGSHGYVGHGVEITF